MKSSPKLKRCTRCGIDQGLVYFPFTGPRESGPRSPICAHCRKLFGETCSRCGRAKELKHFCNHDGTHREGPFPVCNRCLVSSEYQCLKSEQNAEALQRFTEADNARRAEEASVIPRSERMPSLYLYSILGITERELKEIKAQMIREQGGKCAICGQLFTDKLRPALDHCHASDRLRDVLCGNCNTMLGQAHDDPATLRKAADYLERHSKVEQLKPA